MKPDPALVALAIVLAAAVVQVGLVKAGEPQAVWLYCVVLEWCN